MDSLLDILFRCLDYAMLHRVASREGSFFLDPFKIKFMLIFLWQHGHYCRAMLESGMNLGSFLWGPQSTIGLLTSSCGKGLFAWKTTGCQFPGQYRGPNLKLGRVPLVIRNQEIYSWMSGVSYKWNILWCLVIKLDKHYIKNTNNYFEIMRTFYNIFSSLGEHLFWLNL